jgi:hypothetical protein
MKTTILLLAVLLCSCNRIHQSVDYEKGVWVSVKEPSYCPDILNPGSDTISNRFVFHSWWSGRRDTFVIRTRITVLPFTDEGYDQIEYCSRKNLNAVMCSEYKKAQAYKARQKEIKKILRHSEKCK